jgi:hypothetical protein
MVLVGVRSEHLDSRDARVCTNRDFKNAMDGMLILSCMYLVNPEFPFGSCAHIDDRQKANGAG